MKRKSNPLASREAGEITVTEAAARFGVHRNTVLKWVYQARSGHPGPVKRARQDYVGRYWLDGDEVDAEISSKLDPDSLL